MIRHISQGFGNKSLDETCSKLYLFSLSNTAMKHQVTVFKASKSIFFSPSLSDVAKACTVVILIFWDLENQRHAARRRIHPNKEDIKACTKFQAHICFFAAMKDHYWKKKFNIVFTKNTEYFQREQKATLKMSGRKYFF